MYCSLGCTRTPFPSLTLRMLQLQQTAAPTATLLGCLHAVLVKGKSDLTLSGLKVSLVDDKYGLIRQTDIWIMFCVFVSSIKC